MKIPLSRTFFSIFKHFLQQHICGFWIKCGNQSKERKKLDHSLWVLNDMNIYWDFNSLVDNMKYYMNYFFRFLNPFISNMYADFGKNLMINRKRTKIWTILSGFWTIWTFIEILIAWSIIWNMVDKRNLVGNLKFKVKLGR